MSKNSFTYLLKKQARQTTYSFLAEQFGVEAEPVVGNIEKALQ